MKTFADELATQMNQIMDSSEHKSVFGVSQIGKFASKKKEDDEDDEKEDKKDKKDKKEDKKDKKAKLQEVVEGIARYSADLDELGLVKSSLDTIKSLETIASEVKEKEEKEDKEEDKDSDDKKDKDEDKKDKKEGKDKDEDKNDAYDKSYDNDYMPSHSQPRVVEEIENLKNMHPKVEQPKVEQPKVEQPKVEQPDVGYALDEEIFKDVDFDIPEHDKSPVDKPMAPLGTGEIGTDELLSMLEAADIKLTPEQQGKLSDMLEGGMQAQARAMSIVGKLLAKKFG